MTGGPDDRETSDLQRQIEDLKSALDAIRSGGVDAVVMGTPDHEQIYTLASADRPYRVIVEEMGEGAATVSAGGIVLYANLRLAELLNCDRGALLGRPVADLVTPADRQALSALLTAPPGVTSRAELEFVRAPAAPVPALVSVVGLDIEGAVVRCLVVSDLSQRRAAEQQLEDAHRALMTWTTELEATNTLLGVTIDELGRAKAELEEAQRVAHVGSWVWRPPPGTIAWSKELLAIFELDESDLPLTLEEALRKRSDPEEAERVLALHREVLRQDGPFELAHRLRMPDGAVRHVLTRGEVLRDAKGAVTALRGTTQDVTQLREAERALARSSAQFAAAFECTSVGMALVGLDRTILRGNAALSAMTGYPPSELRGMGIDLLTETSTSDLEQFAELVSGQRDSYRCEVRIVRSDGVRRWAAVSVAVVHSDEGEDYAAFHIEDISDRKHYEGQLQYLADHDPLTGLLNRRRLHEELAHALAIDTRYDAGGALVLLDLDGFKYINDTLGHPMGDALLGVLSAAIRSRLRGSDVLARLGGDEFAVLLYGVDGPGAVALVTDLLAAIREQGVVTESGRVRTSASAGIALLDGSAGTTADEVLANADLAMYAAKAAGGDGFLVYDAAGPAAALSRAKMVWIDRVRQALEEDLFTLLAQPILDLESQEVRGCELLLRMRYEDRLVAPEEFLPIAERHGLASAIDTEVIRKGIALVAALAPVSSFRWEINICGASLDDPELPRVIEEELARHGVAPSSLVFEITETSAITNMSQAQEFAARVTGLGCGFALDDFGAGYGGFYYLKYLPLDYLKIDGEFIRDLVTNRTNQVIVRAMVAAARPLGKQTIAEYVLDQGTCDLLCELHVDHAQGFFVGAPMDPAQLLAELPRFPRLVDLTRPGRLENLNRP